MIFYKPATSYTLAISGTSAHTVNPIPAGIGVLRVAPLADAWIHLATNTTDVASNSDGASVFIPGLTVEYFVVTAGQYVHAVSNDGSAQNINFTEMTR